MIMMYKRLTLAALLVLTPALSHGVGAEMVKQDILATINELQKVTIPAVKQIAQDIKDKNFKAVEEYLSQSGHKLIPQEALAFGQNNIAAVQKALDQLLAWQMDKDKEKEMVSNLNKLQDGLGTNLLALKKKAADNLQKADFEDAYAKFANIAGSITVGDAKKFAENLEANYKKAKINPAALEKSANSLGATLAPLMSVAQNLKDQGVLDTLNNLATTLPDFIKGDNAAREELSDTLIGLLNDLNSQSAEITALINAFAPFARELIKFTAQLYTTFGPELWAQDPAAETAANEALAQLKNNENKIKNAINIVQDKISSVLK